MKNRFLNVVVGVFALVAVQAQGADVNRHISVEIDPLSPAAAARDSAKGDPTSMFGGGVDFNLGNISTGPEVWTGTYVRKGATGDCGNSLRATPLSIGELQCGDRFKMDAVRLRWTVGLWESTYTMRGLFLKGGYSYTKIQSKDTRGNALESSLRGVAQEPTTTDVVDMRQGGVAVVGQRWAFWDHTGTVTLSMSSFILEPSSR